MKTKLLLFILIFSTTVLSANNVIERGDDVKAITSWQSLNQFNHSRENGLKIWIEQPEIQLDSVVEIGRAHV